MLKPRRLDEQIIEFIKNWFPEWKKETFERQRQNDKVVIWIVGLSTGAIALILSQYNSIDSVPILSIKLTVSFLVLTIIAGVVFRSFFYILEEAESGLSIYLEGYLYGSSCEIHGPREIKEVHTIADIANYLKEDLGLNYDQWLGDNLPRDFWVKLYNDWASFWKKSEEEGLKNLGKAFAPLLGKKPEETEDLFLRRREDKNTPQKAVKLRIICNISYYAMSLFFVLSILAIGMGFLLI